MSTGIYHFPNHNMSIIDYDKVSKAIYNTVLVKHLNFHSPDFRTFLRIFAANSVSCQISTCYY